MRNEIATRAVFCPSGMLLAMAVAAVSLSDPPAFATSGSVPFAWPASLAPFGDGYPTAGDVCRRLGESSETSNYLDHTATLVGCPGASDNVSAQAIVRERHGRVVGEAHGVTLISVPNEGGSAGEAALAVAPGHSNAQTSNGTLRCARRTGQRLRPCRFEIVHHDDRTVVLVVDLSHGETRAIFFGPDRTITGIARKASDRPMRGNTGVRKKADVSVISVGRERYEVRDAVLDRD